MISSRDLLLFRRFFRGNKTVVVCVIATELGDHALRQRAAIFAHRYLAVAIRVARREPRRQAGRQLVTSFREAIRMTRIGVFAGAACRAGENAFGRRVIGFRLAITAGAAILAFISAFSGTL